MSKWIELNNMVKVTDENGLYQFDRDKEAVKDYFVNHINGNMQWFHDGVEEKLDYLFKYEYYDKEVFDKYDFKDVKKLYKFVYGKEFRFPSFMSAYKFYDTYALKTNDGSRFLERYEDRVVANALFLGDGDFEKAKRIAKQIIKQNYQPATPTFLNSIRKRSGELISCFLIDIQDSTEGIFYAIESAGQLSRIGGGVGLNLSRLRADGDPIKQIENAGSGVVGVAKILEDVFSHFNQLG